MLLVLLFSAPPGGKLVLPFQRFLNVSVKEVEKDHYQWHFILLCVYVCGIRASKSACIMSK